jgi:hypothetical protein
MVDLPKVVKRGRITPCQITPKGVEALNIAIIEEERKSSIWQYKLIRQYGWDPSTASRVAHALVEAGYWHNEAYTAPDMRCNFTLTERGKEVGSEYVRASQRMTIPSSMTNLGAGELVIGMSDLYFRMPPGGYISAPDVLRKLRVVSIEGEPVVSSKVRQCQYCGKIHSIETSCRNLDFVHM